MKNQYGFVLARREWYCIRIQQTLKKLVTREEDYIHLTGLDNASSRGGSEMNVGM